MKMKTGAAFLLAAVTALSFTGYSGSVKAAESSEELPVLRVAAMPTITSLPTYYIQKMD